jgi:hypothetical protein
MGHSWKSVRGALLITKPEFDRLLDDAVTKVRTEQEKVAAEYVALEHLR